MKIKINNLSFKGDNQKLDIESGEFEITIQEMLQLIKEQGKVYKQNRNPIKPVPPAIFYGFPKIAVIHPGDIARILPSAECRTNADEIKYDESIDGMQVQIIDVHQIEKLVSVKAIRSNKASESITPVFKVHSHWLKLENPRD